MHIKQGKFLTGSTISLLFWTIATTSAAANPTIQQAQRPSRISQNQGTTGTIKSIVGNLVTVKLNNSETTTIWVSRWEQGQLNLREGNDVVVVDNRIVGLARQEIAVQRTETLNSRTAAIWQEIEQSRRQRTQRTIPRRSVQPVTTIRRTEETEPVRALW